jgi:hypothetical protein
MLSPDSFDASIMISPRDIHIADAAEEAIPSDNESLIRIRIERMQRKILELGLRTQEDILYMEQAADAQKTDLLEKLRGMEPYAAITDLQTETVNELHEEATSLRKQMKIFERKISEQASIAEELTKEGQVIQGGNEKLLVFIKHHQREYVRQSSALDHLNYVHMMIGSVLVPKPAVP